MEWIHESHRMRLRNEAEKKKLQAAEKRQHPQLEIGDRVYQQLRTGDPALMARHPVF